MALPTPFDEPPRAPLAENGQVWANWSKWFWQLYKRIKEGALGGTVTSVALAAPTEFVVTGSPITGAGTLTLTKKVENANKGWFGPTTGADAQPTFRALVTADLPSGTGTVTSVASNFTGGLISVGGSPITTSGTLALTVAGTSGGIPYFSGATTWASSGVLGSTQVVLGGGAGTAPNTSANLTFDGTTLATTGINNSGNTTLGDASGDVLTVNAGTITYGANWTSTRAAGALPAGVSILTWEAYTFSGDSGGTSFVVASYGTETYSGANPSPGVIGYRRDVTHSGSATITSMTGFQSNPKLSSTGNVVSVDAFRSTIEVQSSGSATTGYIGFNATAAQFSSTGSLLTCVGFAAQNQGHATLVTNAIGFDAVNMTAALTLTAAYRSNMGAGTGKWSFYDVGGANNSFKGNVRIGSNIAPTVALDVTGQGKFSGSLATLGGITTSGVVGSPAIVATGRSTAQTAAVASVSTFTVGAADGSFEVSANVNVTTATTHNFTVTCAYTDETNTAQTLTLGFTQLSGATFLTAITNITGVGPYESPTYHLRCKASTAITIATTGTFTAVAYNAEGIIKQVN